jgi:hypothetical protein
MNLISLAEGDFNASLEDEPVKGCPVMQPVSSGGKVGRC